MAWNDNAFYCAYCKKKFENDPIKLAIHIRQSHEKGRGILK